MNTSSSALGISDNDIIVGTGVHNGETRAYAMVPVTGDPDANSQRPPRLLHQHRAALSTVSGRTLME